MASLSMQMSDSSLNRRKFGWLAISGTNHLVWFPARNIQSLAPILNAQSNPINLNPDVRGCISALNQHSRPLAIAGLVISIVINAINRVTLGWSKPHIRKKVFKNLPAITYLDSTTAVSAVFWSIRVATSVSHFGPYIPLRRMTLPMEVLSPESINPKHGCSALTSQATAAKSGLSDVCGGYNASISAVAQTFPHCITGFRCNSSFKNNKATMALVSKIESNRHEFLQLIIANTVKLGYIGSEVNG